MKRRRSRAPSAPTVVFGAAALVYALLRSNNHSYDSVHYARIAESATCIFCGCVCDDMDLSRIKITAITADVPLAWPGYCEMLTGF